MIFDTHAHYDDEAFQEDRELLLSNMQEQGITKIVNVGASMNSSRTTLELAEKYPYIYAAIGVHPEETAELTEADMEWLREKSSLEKVVAIGEIGLDYYWESVPRQTQQIWFKRQLELAQEVDLPVIIHSRDASKDTMDMLRKADKVQKLKGIIHCYSYSVETAKAYLDMGFYFGIGGVLTFKNAKKLKETVEMLPLESILLETDCPYLAPVPHRGDRNSSMNLPYVIEEIAALKHISVEQVEKQTYENACKIYGIQGQ